MQCRLTTPLSEPELLTPLYPGDALLLSGKVFAARDAAHERMFEALKAGKKLPFELKDNVIYYMGPSPARPGRAIGSAGPTTSGRMDSYTPLLLRLGLKGMIGKGKRSEEVRKAIVETKAVYFAAIGGAGALLSKAITASKVIAYEDLGTEAIRELIVKDLPVFVAMDCRGDTVYR